MFLYLFLLMATSLFANEEQCKENYKICLEDKTELENKHKELNEKCEILRKRLRTKMSDIKRFTAAERPMYYEEIENIFRAIENEKTSRKTIYIERLKQNISLTAAKPIAKLYAEEWCNDFYTEDRTIEGEDGEEFKISFILQTILFYPKAFDWLLSELNDGNEFYNKFLHVTVEQYQRVLKYIKDGKILNDKDDTDNIHLLCKSLLQIKSIDEDLKKEIRKQQVNLLGALQTFSKLVELKSEYNEKKYKDTIQRYGKLESKLIPQSLKEKITKAISFLTKKSKK